MNNVLIGRIKINLEAYTKRELVKRDDWKSELLTLVESTTNLDVVAENTTVWAHRYHLSSKRQKLLSWYDFSKIDTILEIGSGCGAITGLLSNNCERLICVDESFRRTQINATRHKHVKNISMLVGNVLDMQFEQKFDLITLIGVYEYIASCEDDSHSFLHKLRRWLTPNGKILLAIENKYGLEYWAGYAEDHTGRVFDSLEGYQRKGDAITFSHNRIRQMLSVARFDTITFYYPMPDYKFPTMIFSDNNLPKKSDFPLIKNYRNSERSTFDEEIVMLELVKDGLFPVFANSFLIEATLKYTK